MTKFFANWQDVANNPENLAARQALAQQAQSLATAFNGAWTALANQRAADDTRDRRHDHRRDRRAEPAHGRDRDAQRPDRQAGAGGRRRSTPSRRPSSSPARRRTTCSTAATCCSTSSAKLDQHHERHLRRPQPRDRRRRRHHGGHAGRRPGADHPRRHRHARSPTATSRAAACRRSRTRTSTCSTRRTRPRTRRGSTRSRRRCTTQINTQHAIGIDLGGHGRRRRSSTCPAARRPAPRPRIRCRARRSSTTRAPSPRARPAQGPGSQRQRPRHPGAAQRRDDRRHDLRGLLLRASSRASARPRRTPSARSTRTGIVVSDARVAALRGLRRLARRGDDEHAALPARLLGGRARADARWTRTSSVSSTRPAGSACSDGTRHELRPGRGARSPTCRRRTRRLARSQNELSSGKRIQRAEDDPFGTGRALFLRNQVGDLTQYQRNVDEAQGWLEATTSR